MIPRLKLFRGYSAMLPHIYIAPLIFQRLYTIETTCGTSVIPADGILLHLQAYSGILPSRRNNRGMRRPAFPGCAFNLLRLHPPPRPARKTAFQASSGQHSQPAAIQRIVQGVITSIFHHLRTTRVRALQRICTHRRAARVKCRVIKNYLRYLRAVWCGM